MPTFSLFGKSVELPATPAPRDVTSDGTAWLNRSYLTVRVTQPFEALRVHTAGKNFPGRNGSREDGIWLLIGDVAHTSSQLASDRSLPTRDPHSAVAFTHVSEARVAPGTVLNIGIASAKFSGVGGGFQAEHVGGPRLTFRPLVGKRWHDAVGSA